MGLGLIVRNIREHFCSTKTDLSDTVEDHDVKVNQCTECKEKFHTSERLDTLKLLIKGLSTGATHKLVKDMSS